MNQLKYNHPSVPPKNISVNGIYELDELKKTFDFSSIKTLFAPINFQWSDLEKKVNKVSNNQKVD